MIISQKRNNLLLLTSLSIVLIVTLMPGNGKVAGNYLDKVVHFMVFLFLSYRIGWKFRDSDQLISVLFGAILLGFATEFVQQFIPGRNMEIYDALADTFGVIVGYYLFQRKLKKEKDV